MPRLSWSIGVLALMLAPASPAQDKFTLSEKESTPPKSVNADIAKLLSTKGIEVSNGAGQPFAEVWFRADVPAAATPEQIKNGITYREVKQGELLGVVRVEKEWLDYRKQRVPAGVYTLRLAYQPQDGDHMGMGEFQEYALLIDAEKDSSPTPLEPEVMAKLSIKTIKTGHPGVLMLVPTPAKGKEVELVSRPRNQWALNARREITSGGKKTGATFAIGLTVEGHAAE